MLPFKLKFEHVVALGQALFVAIAAIVWAVTVATHSETSADQQKEWRGEVKEQLLAINRKLENLPGYAVKITEIERRITDVETWQRGRR